MSDLITFFPEGKEVKIAGQMFKIKPFVLKNRTKVLRIIAEAIFKIKADMPKDTSDKEALAKMIDTDPAAIMKLIETAGENLKEVYEIVLEKPREWLEENIQLTDELIILQTISEVNNLPFLWTQVAGVLKGLALKKTF